MSFDIAMPLTLCAVTLVSLYLNQKTESKLKVALEEREFSTRDAVLLVVLMAVMVSVIVFLRAQMSWLMVLFMFSYSMLLFLFTYLFSNKRWYVAVVPPAVFILLYVFLNQTVLWSDFLVNIYGVVFAVLITLYMVSLFTWKTTIIFTALLTAVDVILVLVTETMVAAANAAIGLKLPVMVAVPLVPFSVNELGVYSRMYLGLGDFFFAGLLAIQTFKKYGKRFGIVSVVAMAVSFFIFETVLLTFGPRPFPGTLMIICGWIPLIVWKTMKH